MTDDHTGKVVISRKADEEIVIHKDGDIVAVLSARPRRGQQSTIAVELYDGIQADRGEVYDRMYPEAS